MEYGRRMGAPSFFFFFFFCWCKVGEFSFTFGSRQGLVGIKEWAENQKRNALPLKLENRCVFHSIQVNIVS